MTYEEAKKILHPDTTLTTLAEIEYYSGFNGGTAKRKAIDEACLVACEALDKGVVKEVIIKDRDYYEDYFCPVCKKQQKNSRKNRYKGCFCERCGQKLSFSNVMK